MESTQKSRAAASFDLFSTVSTAFNLKEYHTTSFSSAQSSETLKKAKATLHAACPGICFMIKFGNVSHLQRLFKAWLLLAMQANTPPLSV